MQVNSEAHTKREQDIVQKEKGIQRAHVLERAVSQKHQNQSDGIEGQRTLLADLVDQLANLRSRHRDQDRIDQLQKQHVLNGHTINDDQGKGSKDGKDLSATPFQKREDVVQVVLPPKNDAASRATLGMGRKLAT